MDTVQDDTPIQAMAFATAHREWQDLQFCLQRSCHINELECAACWPKPHSVHIDGNMKLKCMEGNKGNDRTSLYGDALMLSSDLAQVNLRELDLALDVKRAEVRSLCAWQQPGVFASAAIIGTICNDIARQAWHNEHCHG